MGRTRPVPDSAVPPRPDLTGDGAEAAPSAEPAPTLAGLAPVACSRIVHYIVTSTLERGVAPAAVAALYADLSDDERATRYVDQRFRLKHLPVDWRAVEDRVLDLEETARQRGTDLSAAWRRAADVAMRGDDPLEQLARLAGVRGGPARAERSIFDDPEDLDALEAEEGPLARAALVDRLPDLADLALEAQERIRRYAVEERLEYGLAPAELLELYRGFEQAEDDRARQYLDRVFVQRDPPADWLDVQREALRVRDLAERRGQDAGRLYAAIRRAYEGVEALTALRLVAERLQRG